MVLIVMLFHTFKLKQFNFKREIYKTDNINNLRNIIKDVQKECESDI
jgi:hypothetical protein